MPSGPAGDPPAIISRAQAKAQGLKRYFTGEPCLRGHVGERHVSGGNCVECHTNWLRDNPEYMKNWRQANRGRWSAWARANPVSGLLHDAKRRAKKTGRDFNLLPADIHIPTHCPCCGQGLVRGVGKASPASPSIDRQDNDKGYIKGNVDIICCRCNRRKADSNVDELTAVLNYMKRPR